MTDFISCAALYGDFPRTMLELNGRLADLSYFSQPVAADDIESSSEPLTVTADSAYPAQAVQNWWSIFIATLQAQAGVSVGSLIERRLIRCQWIAKPVFGRRGQNFAVKGTIKLIKMRFVKDEPAQPDSDVA